MRALSLTIGVTLEPLQPLNNSLPINTLKFKNDNQQMNENQWNSDISIDKEGLKGDLISKQQTEVQIGNTELHLATTIQGLNTPATGENRHDTQKLQKTTVSKGRGKEELKPLNNKSQEKMSKKKRDSSKRRQQIEVEQQGNQMDIASDQQHGSDSPKEPYILNIFPHINDEYEVLNSEDEYDQDTQPIEENGNDDDETSEHLIKDLGLQ